MIREMGADPDPGEPARREANAYVALGSNLGDRLGVLRTVVGELDASTSSRVIAVSSVFEARAWVPIGGAPQPDFLNAMLVLETALPPFDVLVELLALERRHGRVRAERWAARTLDLDLIAYVDAGSKTSVVLDRPGLVLPHPRAGERDFVLAPLAELAPELVLDGRTVASRLATLPRDARTVTRRLPDPLRTPSAILPPAGG
jgi:2-amino-4-hydroxy-6-hydroxymethyldihydropteridine diphosphokinase